MNSITSIVVPIYNAEPYLEKAVDSLLAQTCDKVEVILVNDGSTDGSLDICRRFESTDGRVKVIDQKNSGSVAARRAGIEAATGEYMMFCDADDWYAPDALEALLNKLEEQDADIAVGRFVKTKFINNKKSVNSFDTLDRFMQGQDVCVYEGSALKEKLLRSFLFGASFPCSQCAKLYKKCLFRDMDKYTQGIKFYGDDLYTNMALFGNANKVVLTDKVVYYYREGGDTSKYMPYFFDDTVNGYKNKLKLISDFTFNGDEDVRRLSEFFLALIETTVNNLVIGISMTKQEYMDKINSYINNPVVREACDRSDYNNLPDFERNIVDKNAGAIYKTAVKTKIRFKFTRITKNAMARFGLLR